MGNPIKIVDLVKNIDLKGRKIKESENEDGIEINNRS